MQRRANDLAGLPSVCLPLLLFPHQVSSRSFLHNRFILSDMIHLWLPSPPRSWWFYPQMQRQGEVGAGESWTDQTPRRWPRRVWRSCKPHEDQIWEDGEDENAEGTCRSDERWKGGWRVEEEGNKTKNAEAIRYEKKLKVEWREQAKQSSHHEHYCQMVSD